MEAVIPSVQCQLLAIGIIKDIARNVMIIYKHRWRPPFAVVLTTSNSCQTVFRFSLYLQKWHRHLQYYPGPACPERSGP